MQLNQVTGNIELMTIGGSIAIDTAREALRLYAKRSATNIPDMSRFPRIIGFVGSLVVLTLPRVYPGYLAQPCPPT
jgi:hypothetical protein